MSSNDFWYGYVAGGSGARPAVIEQTIISYENEAYDADLVFSILRQLLKRQEAYMPSNITLDEIMSQTYFNEKNWLTINDKHRQNLKNTLQLLNQTMITSNPDFQAIMANPTPEVKASIDRINEAMTAHRHLIETLLMEKEYARMLEQQAIDYNKEQGHFDHLCASYVDYKLPLTIPSIQTITPIVTAARDLAMKDDAEHKKTKRPTMFNGDWDATATSINKRLSMHYTNLKKLQEYMTRLTPLSEQEKEDFHILQKEYLPDAPRSRVFSVEAVKKVFDVVAEKYNKASARLIEHNKTQPVMFGLADWESKNKPIRTEYTLLKDHHESITAINGRVKDLLVVPEHVLQASIKRTSPDAASIADIRALSSANREEFEASPAPSETMAELIAARKDLFERAKAKGEGTPEMMAELMVLSRKFAAHTLKSNDQP
jgi:hypothetical protein